jgi:hypothetical protein
MSAVRLWIGLSCGTLSTCDEEKTHTHTHTHTLCHLPKRRRKKWTPSLIRFVLKNEHENDTYYDEIRLSACKVDIVLGSIVSTIVFTLR